MADGLPVDKLRVLESAAAHCSNNGLAELSREELESMGLDEWLESLSLSNYAETFRGNFFTSMDRVAAIWDDELTSILDVEKVAKLID